MSRFWEWLRRRVGDSFRPCGTPWWEDELVGCAHATVPVGPRNTYSNLAYAVAGVVLIAVYRTPEALVFGLFMFFLLAPGSAVYHAVPSPKTNAIDHAGMYSVFLSMATYAAGGTWVPMLAAAGAGTVGFKLVWKANLNAMMGVFLWFTWVPAWASGTRPLLYASVGAFAVAMLAWLCGKRRRVKRLALWHHAIWHILTAAAIVLSVAALS